MAGAAYLPRSPTKQLAPDGYTLFLANNGLFAIMPALTPDIRFDPVKDFQPITPLFAFPSVLVVPAEFTGAQRRRI